MLLLEILEAISFMLVNSAVLLLCGADGGCSVKYLFLGTSLADENHFRVNHHTLWILREVSNFHSQKPPSDSHLGESRYGKIKGFKIRV